VSVEEIQSILEMQARQTEVFTTALVSLGLLQLTIDNKKNRGGLVFLAIYDCVKLRIDFCYEKNGDNNPT
jgi:hypothetical protein